MHVERLSQQQSVDTDIGASCTQLLGPRSVLTLVIILVIIAVGEQCM